MSFLKKDRVLKVLLLLLGVVEESRQDGPFGSSLLMGFLEQHLDRILSFVVFLYFVLLVRPFGSTWEVFTMLG